MTTIEILEGGGDRFLHLHIKSKGTVLSKISDEDFEHLKETLENPTPIQDKGQYPIEILEGGGNELFVGIELDEFGALVAVHDVTDLDRLRETIRTPQRFNASGSIIR